MTRPRTISEALRLAASRPESREGVRAAAAVADTLRNRGLNYNQTVAFVQEREPTIDADAWESLMYLADTGFG